MDTAKTHLERIIARLRAAVEVWAIRRLVGGFYSLAAFAPSSSRSPMATASLGTVN